MTYYPIFLRLGGRRCVVIGGGRVAARKVDSLLDAGAVVTVVAPRLTAALAARAERREVEWIERGYAAGDLAGAALAYAATDDEALHARLADDAAAAGILLNVVDRPQWCGFIVPSLLTRGALTVAVSTGGGSPALARRVRQDIERALGPEYERALDVLARLRRHLQARPLSSDDRQRILTGLVASDLLDRLRAPDTAAVDRLLAEHVGGGVSLASLGAQL
ncbi:MAG: precorrin-2 dehydrogenase/sirohydrochlorin ferrochelatase family protein [Candidatus Binatia bacterium]